MLSISEALQHMLGQLSLRMTDEQIPLSAAVDRILAADVISELDIPAYNNSAMDGYGLVVNEVETKTRLHTFEVIGEALAGHPFQGKIERGQAIRIMTGAAVPEEVNAVVPIEDTSLDSHTREMTVLNSFKIGQHIRRRGEELSQGARVFARGHQIRPVDVGLLASLGIATLNVYKPLTVALFSTGDELVQPGQPRRSDQIFDSNRFVLHAMLERAGFNVLNLGLIPDNEMEIADAFVAAASRADAIVCSGGVSVGDADYTKQVIDKMGNVGFWKVAMKPGKPFAFGQVNGSWFFGLPGNPVSATVTLQQLALPALYKLAGKSSTPPLLIHAVAGEPLKKRPGRADFQRGVLKTKDGINQVFSAGPQGSGMLSSICHANCLIRLSNEQGGVQPGEKVTVEILQAPYF